MVQFCNATSHDFPAQINFTFTRIFLLFSSLTTSSTLCFCTHSHPFIKKVLSQHIFNYSTRLGNCVTDSEKYSTCHMHDHFLLHAFCNENSFMLHFFIVAVSCHSNFYSSHSLKANFSHKMRVLENCTIEDCRSRWKCA